jgi:hypothetical protein
MFRKLRGLLLPAACLQWLPSVAQNLPGDSLVYGPIFSAVYGDTVRVWVLTRANTGSGVTLSLDVRQGTTGSPLSGIVADSDSRLGCFLRSYTYTGLVAGQTYTASIRRNGTTVRTSAIRSQQNTLSDFSFLAGGCGRIMDTTRCVDRFEGMSHINGTTAIYRQMAGEKSDMMVWLGDAVYLFGIEHSGGTCPGMVNDWDNRDALFSRYYFNRQFHDTLMRAMPQLAITDNHDVGGNEFNKTMPTLGLAKTNFMNWWQNPVYTKNPAGQGLYSSYRYKDVEFFLLDNRSYRESTTRHLGPDQLRWLLAALKNSTATFKVLISGTPSFDKHWGGRNFSITTECDTMVRYIKANNIDGVLSYSADIHAQEFYGRYNDHSYPFFDVLSGNLASDIGSGNTAITPDKDDIFNAVIQTYTRTNIYGLKGDRRYRIEYMSPNGVRYYGTVIHEDMLRSVDDSTLKLKLAFNGNLGDSSKYNRTLTSTGIRYTTGRDGMASSAVSLNGTSSVTIPHTAELDLHDRTFSIPYWINPAQLPTAGYATVLSNSNGLNGCSFAIDAAGHCLFINHATKQTYTTAVRLRARDWAHVAWKYDNVKLQLFFYWNGRMVQRWSGVASPDSSAANLTIGANFGGNHFSGSIDAMSVYGKLIGDRSIQDMSGYAPGRGTALAMAGSQAMYLPSAQTNPLFSGAFTMECWARFTGSVGGVLVSGHGRVNNNTTGWDIEYTNNKPNLVFGTNTNNWNKISEAGFPWAIGEWNHIAVTAVPSDSLYLYVNGIKVGSSKFAQFYGNSFNFGLAKSSSYGTTAPVEMDEFRIWNAAQPADSIRARMHYKLSGTEPNLAYYYDFSANTDTTIRSKGSIQTELLLNGGTLVPSSAPNTEIRPEFRSVVAGNWTIRRTANAGLELRDAITDLTANIISGKQPDSTLIAVPYMASTYAVRGGWQLNALNIPVGNLSLEPRSVLPKFDSISKSASEYYLLKQDTGRSMSSVASGYYDGERLQFLNAVLDTGIYYFGWKADTGAALFHRGAALSMLGAHKMSIPAAGANAAMSGAFTIEFWSRLMATPKDENNSLISNHGRVTNLTRGFTVEFPRGSGLLQATVGLNNNDWIKMTADKAVEIGEWNHVAISVTPGDSIRLYMNGAQVSSRAINTVYPGATALGLGYSPNYGSEIVGMLDEVRIWRRVRTAAEILENMHLSLPAGDTDLAYNYSFNEAGPVLHSSGASRDSITLNNAKLIPGTSPVGSIALAQQRHVTGSWSLRDSTNSGLSILVPIADYETNLVVGKDTLSGSSASPTVQNLRNMHTRWQLDPLKLSRGELIFDGPAVLGNDWTTVKPVAVEYYLLREDATGQLVVQSAANEVNNKITFQLQNLSKGMYTLGWKSQATGLVETQTGSIRFFPNPGNGQVTISGINADEIAEIYVHDMNGASQAVSTQKSAQQVKINISGYKAGTYMIVIAKKDGTRQALKLIRL